MKTRITLLLFFVSFLFIHSPSAQILTNGGFENWATGPSSYLDPVGWFTSNGVASAANIVQAPGRTGAYSAGLLSVLGSSSQIMQADLSFMYNGNLKPLVLSGYWKGNLLAANDFLYVSIMVRDSSHNEIGFGSAYSPILTNVTTWTPFSATINYTSSNNPTETIIEFSLFSSSLNTTGFVDDLTLTYSSPSGIAQTNPLSGSSLSRDLSGNYFLDLMDSPSSFILNIFSADGRKISEKKYSQDSGNHQIPIYTNELDAGIYFCRITGENLNKTFKFIR